MTVKPSRLAHPQFRDGLGAFAARRFAKGEVVIRWRLKAISVQEYLALPEDERLQFTHRRGGTIYLYPDPERHVNRSSTPNLVPDLQEGADIASSDIEEGEELTIPVAAVEDG